MSSRTLLISPVAVSAFRCRRKQGRARSRRTAAR